MTLVLWAIIYISTPFIANSSGHQRFWFSLDFRLQGFEMPFGLAVVNVSHSFVRIVGVAVLYACGGTKPSEIEAVEKS